MRITSEEATVINIAIGAALAWSSSMVTQYRQRRDARTTRRREAYASMILALDHLERAWSAPETLESEYLSQKMGEVTGHAVREIQRAYVAVLLVGSSEAKLEAKKVRQAAWALNDRLNADGQPSSQKPKLGPLFNEFSEASKNFVSIAEKESG